MKKLFLAFGVISITLFSCTKNNEAGEDNYFYGLWNITHMKTVEFDDSMSTDVAYGDYTYLFEDDGNVTITTIWEPPQTLGWELSANEDSIMFSSGTYFHVTEKADQYFKVKFVEEPVRTEYTFSR